MKNGDLVQLKSGGPLMTVTGSYTLVSGEGIICQWILNGIPYSANYPLDALEVQKTVEFNNEKI